MFHRKQPQLTPAQENAATIRAIPADQLTDAEARAELIRRALAGEDVYAYKPFGTAQWVVWIRGHAWQECRHKPAEWARAWQASRKSQDGSAQ